MESGRPRPSGGHGQFEDPELLAAQERVTRAAHAHGRWAGCGGLRDPALQALAIGKGARFVTTQTDIGFLASAAGAWTARVRDAVG